MAEYWTGAWSTRARSRVYLHDLVYASYCGGMVHDETSDKDLQDTLDRKDTHGWTIDHLDGSASNDTVLDLSLMPLSINVNKKSFPAESVSPYTMTMAYIDGEHRVQFALENTECDHLQQLLDRALPGMFKLDNDAGISAFHFICDDAESLVTCLKYLYDTKLSWRDPGRSARAYKKAHKDVSHMTADIQKSLLAQRTLAQMDRAQFQIFDPGECLDH